MRKHPFDPTMVIIMLHLGEMIASPMVSKTYFGYAGRDIRDSTSGCHRSLEKALWIHYELEGNHREI